MLAIVEHVPVTASTEPQVTCSTWLGEENTAYPILRRVYHYDVTLGSFEFSEAECMP